MNSDSRVPFQPHSSPAKDKKNEFGSIRHLISRPGEESKFEGVQVMAESLRRVSIAKEHATSSSNWRQPAQPVRQAAMPQASIPAIPIRQSRPPPKKGYQARQEKDPKNPPSKASGGVPNVDQKYLQLCAHPPLLLPEPQNLLVVIDLNGTLLYRPSKQNPTKYILRPNAQLFLKYCLDTFTVVIWSSAQPANVRAMCDTIFTSEIGKKKAVAIWARDKFGLSKEDYQLRTQCYKRLTKLWSDKTIQASHPEANMSGKWDHTNTVLIDDSLEKARTEPNNLVEVPEWTGDQRDNVLPQVHDYLNYLSMHSSVGACLRARPWKPSLGRPIPLPALQPGPAQQ